jgi:hypothetical protein
MLAGSARITGHEVYVQMRHLVTNDVQIHVFRALCVLKQTCHSAAGSAYGGRFLVVKVAHAGYMPLRLDDELAPIGSRSWPIDVSDINQVTLVQHATLGVVSEAMLLADEAVR